MKNCLWIAVILLLAARSVEASTIVNSSTFLPGPINITFDTPPVTPDTPVTTQYAALGATFSGAVQGDVGNALTIPNQDGHAIQDFISNGPNFQPLTITFNTPVFAADFALAYQPGHALITSYLNGVQVEQFTGVTPGPNGPGSGIFQADNIYGFQDSLFNSISIVISSSDRADIIDNLQFTPAPEPSSVVALCGLCAFGSLLFARRRRKA